MAIVTLDGGQSAAGAAGQTALYLRQLLQQQLNGCPDTLVDAQLQLVLKDFYSFTTAWRDTIGPYSINQNQDTVALNPVDQNRQVQFVLRAWIYPLLGGNTRQFLTPVARKVIGNDKDLPTTFYMEDPTTLVLYPVPDKTYGRGLYVYASLIPTALAAQLPVITFTHHLDAILWGALARLYRMPQKPWTDKGLAADYAKDYRRQRLLWRDVAERNYGPGDAPMVFPPFAGKSSSQILEKAVLG